MKSNSFPKFLFLAIGIIFLGCGKRNGETINLKLKYKTGEIERIVAETFTEGGPVKYKSIMEMNFKVDSIRDNVYVFDVKVLRITSESDMFGEKESYDSRKDVSLMTIEEKNMHLDFKGVLDASFSLSLNDKGKVTEPFKYKESNIPAEEIIDMANIQIPFPEENVKIGSEWTGEKLNSLTKAKTNSKYKITDINSKEIVISIESEIGGIPGVLDKNKAVGQYVLDRETCQLIKAEFSMEIQGGNGKAVFKMYTQ